MRLIAHRGESARAPENTLAAFRSLSEHAAGVELDLTWSRDRHAVVIHDAELERTTDGSGAVADKDLAELLRLDAGSWFAPKFRGERIPRLTDVLDQLLGRVELHLELKPEAFEQRTRGPSGKLERADLAQHVVDELVRREGLSQAVLSSFDWRFLRAARRRSAEARLGVLLHEGDPRRALTESQRLEAEAVHLHHALVSRHVVHDVHAAGKTLRVYTVDDPQLARRLRDLEVDALFTNDTRALATALAPGADFSDGRRSP